MQETRTGAEFLNEVIQPRSQKPFIGLHLECSAASALRCVTIAG